jgi:hypothetical protein
LLPGAPSSRLTKAVPFHVCWSGFQVTNLDDLVGNDPNFPAGALRSVLEDGNRLILRATESGHQDPLGYANAVSSEDCLYHIVTRVDNVDCEAGSSSEQHGNVGLVGEGARSAGPPHECHGRVGLGLTLRGNHEKRPSGSQAAWEREFAPSPVLAEVLNAVDVLKPSFCGDQLDDLLHTDNVRLIYLTNDHRLEATGGSLDDRDSIGGDYRHSIVGDG